MCIFMLILLQSVNFQNLKGGKYRKKYKQEKEIQSKK